jgi:hypothetical protein
LTLSCVRSEGKGEGLSIILIAKWRSHLILKLTGVIPKRVSR